MDEFDCFGQCPRARAIRFYVLAARNFSKIFFNIGFGFGNIEITGNRDCHIIRDIPPRVEIPRILQTRRIQIFQRPDDLPIIRMVRRIERFADDIPIMAIGRIIDALPFFIFDDLFFLVDDALGDGLNEPAQFIGFGPNDLL